MSRIKLNDLISSLRNSYPKNKEYYESLFSVLYFTDESFVKENFLKSRNIFRKNKKQIQTLDFQIPHDKYVYTMNVFKNIFGKEFIKSKPMTFLDAFIVCCGDKDMNNSVDVKKILRKKLLTDFDTQNLYKKYDCRNRSGFTRKKIRTFFENYNKNMEKEDDKLFIRYLCDYFNMNICIILPQEKDIIFNSPRDQFSIYYPTIIFEKYKDNQYQYLSMTNKETVFTSSASFIYKLLEYKIRKEFMNYINNANVIPKKISKKSVNSHFILEQNKIDNNKESNKESNEKKSGNLIDVTKVAIEKEIVIKYNKTKLTKMKLKELQSIAEKNNIDIQKPKVGSRKGFKNKTKKELISEIMKI
jgi:hypothetical protein